MCTSYPPGAVQVCLCRWVGGVHVRGRHGSAQMLTGGVKGACREHGKFGVDSLNHVMGMRSVM